MDKSKPRPTRTEKKNVETGMGVELSKVSSIYAVCQKHSLKIDHQKVTFQN